MRNLINAAICSTFSLLISPAIASPLETYFQLDEESSTRQIRRAEKSIIDSDPQSNGMVADEYYTLLIEIGDNRAERGDLENAIAAYERALAFGEEQFGNDSAVLRDVLQPLGLAQAAAGDEQAARQSLLRSAAIGRRAFTPPGDDLEPETLEEEYTYLGEIFPDDPANYRAKAAALRAQAEIRRGRITPLGGVSDDEINVCTDQPDNKRGHQFIEVFYGTHREESGKTLPKDFYLDPKGPITSIPDLKYGAVTVSVPCDKVLGAIPTKNIWRGEFFINKGKHVVMDDLRSIDSEDLFWNDVQERINAPQNDAKEALVFIHGFNVDFEGAALRTAQLAADVELEGAPIFFDWPSRAKMGKRSYDGDREIANSDSIVESLEQFLIDVATKSGAKRIHVVAHSMGNVPLTRALEELSEREDLTQSFPMFDEVVFASPDVSVLDFKGRVKDAIPLAERLTLYASTQDRAVGFSGGFDGTPRAGDVKHVVAINGLDNVDTTAMTPDFLGHSDFASTDDLRAILWHSLSPDDRCILTAEDRGGVPVWAYNPQCKDTVFRAAIVALRREGDAGAIARAEQQIRDSEAQSLPEQASLWRRVKSLIIGFIGQ